jgi:hypothetical protein
VALASCGGSGNTGLAPEANAPLIQVSRVITAATVTRKPGPDFKIRLATAHGLRGLDLWNAVVDPMIAPLEPLDGTSELHNRLNRAQYAVYVLFAVDADYADGGMFEVYYNSSGVFADQAVGLLREVAAPLHAEALAATNRGTWPRGQVPRSEAVRRRALGPQQHPRLHVSGSAWQAAEQREGPLESIIERFIRSRPNAFFY